MTTFYDRVRVTVASAPGTGDIALGSAVNGFQSFSGANVTDGAVVSYVIEDGPSWELGHGTYHASGTTLTRTTILRSSAGNAQPINASAGASVYLDVLAEDLANLGGGLPAGGTIGQVLTNTGPGVGAWENPTGGGGGGGGGGGSGTPPAVVQTAGASTQTGGISWTLGAAPTDGNLLLVIAQTRGTPFPTLASGWSAVASHVSGAYTIGMFAHTAGVGESATQSPFGTGGGSYAGTMWEISGTDPTAIASAPVTYDAPASTVNLAATITNCTSEMTVVGSFFAQADNPSFTLSSDNINLVDDQAFAGFLGNDYYGLAAYHFVAPAVATADVTASRSGTSEAGNSATTPISQAMLAVQLSPPTSGMALVSLSDVDDSTPPTNGQVPTWNSTESKFKFATPASGGGGGGGGGGPVQHRYWQMTNMQPQNPTSSNIVTAFGLVINTDSGYGIVPAATTCSNPLDTTHVPASLYDDYTSHADSSIWAGNNGCNLTFDFGAPVNVLGFTIYGRESSNVAQNIGTFDWSYSDDGVTFTKVTSFTIVPGAFNQAYQIITLNVPMAY